MTAARRSGTALRDMRRSGVATRPRVEAAGAGWTSSDDELASALVTRLEGTFGEMTPVIVPVLVPVLLDAIREATSAPVTTAPAQLLLTVEEAAQRLGIGRTTVFGLIRRGALGSVTVGRRRLVPVGAIEEYVAGLLEPPGVESPGR